MSNFQASKNEISNNSSKTKAIDENIINSSTTILKKFGWFQTRSLLFLSFPIIGQGILFMSFMFLNIVPPFYCQEDQEEIYKKENSVEILKGNGSYQWLLELNRNPCVRFSRIINETTDQSRSNNSSLVFANEKRSCQSDLRFNTSNGNTIVSEFGLVCDLAWMRPFATASFMIGMLFGTVTGGRLADRFGRRLISLISFAVSTMLAFVTAFSPFYWLYVCFVFVNGAMHVLNFLAIYAWAMEIAGSADKRVWASFSFNTAFALGGMLMSLIAYLAKDWNWIYIAEGSSFIVCIVVMWFVPESPHWLLQKRKLKNCETVLKSIVRANKINRTDNNESETKSVELKRQELQTFTSTTEKVEIGAMLLWRNKVLRRRIIIICLLWNIAILSYYTILLNSANLGGNAYVNNVIGNLLDITAIAATTMVLKKFGRKSTYISGMIALGCFCIVSPIAKRGHEIAGITFAMIGRFFSMVVMTITFLLTGELFPTMLRSTSICIASTLSRTAAMLSPFLIFAGEEIDLSIPFYVMGGVSFISILLIVLLPETSSSHLLDSLDDALALKDPKLLSSCKIFCSKQTRSSQSSADVHIIAIKD